MKSIRAALGLLFQSNGESPPSEAWDRMAREIQASIFGLVTLFLLVSLVSYLPLDSLHIFQGHWDRVHNLGGLVGALLGEWFLGTVGIAGYSIVLVTAWIAYLTLKGESLRGKLPQLAGAVIGSILISIACYLLLNDRFPEASLLQGGMVGRVAGRWLIKLFNPTGTFLILAGASVVTAILTSGLSLSRLVRPENAEDSEETEEPTHERARKPKRHLRLAPATASDEAPEAQSSDEEDADEAENDGDVSAEDLGGFAPLIPFTGAYQIPTHRLLKGDATKFKLSRGDLKENAQKLTEHLLSFQITGQIEHISQGPVLTTYEYKPSAGIKLKAIANLQDDLGVVLGTRELRVIAPIPGKTVVGIEIPKPKADTIPLKELIAEKAFFDKKLRLPIALGKSTDGKPVFGDLASMPHLLVAGSTGSGKSVFINALIMSLIYRLTPQELRLILVDPKMLELSVFDGLPHLLTNVITDNGQAYNALNWAVEEMERRYQLMSETGSKNIESYNAKLTVASKKMPFIVIVVDELADLMLSGGDAVETAITRLAQKARAAGIHLVIATQRPSTDVITGLIKANIPSRLAFKVASGIDSRTILDTGGAEELVGRGDSLMIQAAAPLQRIHGCFVTEEELARTAKFIKNGRNFQKFYIQFSKKIPEAK